MAQKWVSIEKITFDSKYQVRRSVTDDVQTEYQAIAESGKESGWPFKAPIEIVSVAGVLYLTDGWQRCGACLKAGRSKVWAEVIEGDLDMVMARACGANADHGVRRTDDDKRNAVRMALAQWPKKPAVEIAEICRVSQALVGKIRKEEHPEQTTITRRDGAEAPAQLKEPTYTAPTEDEAPEGPRGQTKGERCPACDVDWWLTTDAGHDKCGQCGHVHGETVADDEPEEEVEVIAIDPDAAKKVAKTWGQFLRAVDAAGIDDRLKRWTDAISREVAKVSRET